MRNFVTLLTLLIAGSLSFAAPPAGLQTSIDAKIAAFHASEGCRQANVGIIIESLSGRERWYARQANTAFVPASVAKVVTAALALHYLPEDFRFTTQVFTNGEIVDGVLHGDLIVRGGGDPALVTDDLLALAQLLAEGDAERGSAPITQITGHVIFDESFFPRTGPQLGHGWEKDDLPWYYAAPSSALSCNRNALTITVQGGEVNKAANITLTPNTKLFSIDHQVMTRGNVTTGAIQVTRRGNLLCISGRVAPGAVLEEIISVPHPEAIFAEQFSRALQAVGVTVLGRKESGTTDPSRRTLLATHDSPALAEVLAQMLKESDNHTAEQFRWLLISRFMPQIPLDQRFAALQQQFAARTGLPTAGLRLVDGSGLSRLSRLTPDALTQVLTTLAASPRFDDFYQALPIVGVDGTMQKRLIGTAAENNARAKTGTMRGISCLAGYVTTTDGTRLCYTVMINGYTSKAVAARTLQDDIVSYLAGL